MAVLNDFKKMAENGSLACCCIKAALELSGENSTDKNICHILNRLYYSSLNNCIDEDCFVKDADKIFTFLGVSARLIKGDVNSYKSHKYCILEYSSVNNDSNSNYVLYKGGELYYNPREDVPNGIPNGIPNGNIISVKVVAF